MWLRIIKCTLLLCSIGVTALAQRKITMRTMWNRPQVHVAFNGYTISFAIRDLDAALRLLHESGDSVHPVTTALDTALTYTYELLPGTKTEYHHAMQILLQQEIGVFLLTTGHALVEKSRKVIPVIVADTEPSGIADGYQFVSFYNPKNNEMLFSGKMQTLLCNKDLSIDE